MKHCVGLFNDCSVTNFFRFFLMKNANLAILISNIDVLVSYRSLSIAASPICIFFYSYLSHLFLATNYGNYRYSAKQNELHCNRYGK